MLNGIDVSENQGYLRDGETFDGLDFVLIRSSYGSDHIDIQALRNAELARAAGKLVGHYHFCLPAYESGPAQAQYFLSAVPELQPGEPLLFDLERVGVDLPWWCDQFIRVIKDETGIVPLFYVNHDFLATYGFGTVVAHNCGLWIAEPDNVPAQVNGSISPWGFAAFKQYTFGGGKLGDQPVDQDVFYGSADEFRQYGKPGWQHEEAPTVAETQPSGETSSPAEGGLASPSQ